jgi:hypothetical protein
MPAAGGSALLASFDPARRVYRGELTVQGAPAGLRRFLDCPHGAERTHRCAQQGDTGEEQQRFLF